MESDEQNLAQIFERQARRYTGRAFLRDKHQKVWRDHSWSSVAERAARLRAGLAALGIKRGDRVAILSENCVEWVVVDLAVLGLGAIVVPLYTTSGAEERRHVLLDSGARLLAVNGEPLLRQVNELGRLPELETIMTMHPAGATLRGAGRRIISLEQTSALEPLAAVEDGREQLATFIYTSGTSGAAKGVMLSHGNIIANSQSNLRALELTEQTLTLSFLPIAHSFERTAGYYTVVLCGGIIAYAESLGQIAANLLEIKPTVVLTVPRLLEVIYHRIMRTVESSPPMRQRLFRAALAAGTHAAALRHRGRPLPPGLRLKMAFYRRLVFERIVGLFGGRLRYLVSGGAPLPADLNRFFTAAEVPLVEGYGLTEASPAVSCNLHGRTRIGSVGCPLEGVEVRTAADGELLVRGASVMRGYHHGENETREAIDPEGWLHTGDVARIDDEGYITIIDRKKEIIVLSGGKNISPANLESRLSSDPYIAQACVIGDQRKHLAAVLVPNFETLVNLQAQNLGLERDSPEALTNDPRLHAFFRQRLREFNRPLSDAERVLDFILTGQPFSRENGELTPTMKVRRKVVQEHYRDQIDALFAN